MPRIVKWIAIAGLVIIVTPIAFIGGWFVLFENGAFCDPPYAKQFKGYEIKSIRLEELSGDRFSRSSLETENSKIIGDILIYLDERKPGWVGNTAFSAHGTDYSMHFETNPPSHWSVWFNLPSEDFNGLFLSIGDCIQTTSASEAQRFLRILEGIEADQS